MWEFEEDKNKEPCDYNLEDYFTLLHDVPIVCPNGCGSLTLAEREETSLGNILKLKNHSFHLCRKCNYSQSVDDFKRDLFTT